MGSSRATTITVAVAIGVFGVGAGVGSVIAGRTAGDGEIKLAAGTYHLDEQEDPGLTFEPSDPEPSVLPESSDSAEGPGAPEPSEKPRRNGLRVCLTTTTDGRVIAARSGGKAGGKVEDGCTPLPVVVDAAAERLRPGNSTPVPLPSPIATPSGRDCSPKRAPNGVMLTPAVPNSRSGTSPRTTPCPTADPTRTPTRKPTATPTRKPTATPTRKPTATPTRKPTATPTRTPTRKPTATPTRTRTVVPTLTLTPTRTRTVTPTRTPTQKPTATPTRTRTVVPTLTLTPTRGPRPTVTVTRTPTKSPTGRPTPCAPPFPVVTFDAEDREPPPYEDDYDYDTSEPSPTLTVTVTPSPSSGSTATPSATPSPTPTRCRPTPTKKPTARPTTKKPTPTRTATPLPSADGSLPDSVPPNPGPKDPFVQRLDPEDLPVLRDPALMRRAYEALGLDGSKKYTDENGFWDLTIAPPGTPACHEYPEEDARARIRHDSCSLPAFVRWLLVEPEAGEVSNWTKFTGLTERDLTVVVQDPEAEQGDTPPGDDPAPEPAPAPDLDRPDLNAPAPDQVERGPTGYGGS
ncbi:hypothetical protein DP939_42605 [Spongiactinospora rosea]|uniref:Uncharacterized protein n=1 Tax=Spongiactinospora rosea TaxID=2248750 RepID=A0A366LK73_9ACTN|nr:hypothetical protein [Spongiactinospora rosea]RBQ14070.1 hypothetical protein DP939_42605 [Spongiactinospora rosea]